MARPCISVIISTHQEARYLERTICSVLDQGYDNLEVIVIDNGSTDDTPAILENYRNDLAAIEVVHTDNLGDALNRGLTHATGEIIGLLYGSALYLPGTLDAAAAVMTGPYALDWITGHSLRVDSHDQALGQLHAQPPASLASYLMHNSGVLPAVASFYRRPILLAQGGLDTQLPAAIGYELGARFLAAGHRPTVVPQVFTAVREHEEVADVAHMLRRGLAYVEAAQRHAETLPPRERYALWRNCDERRRIYTLAEAECKASEARRYLWHRLLRRPWWLADDHYRRSLLHGHRHIASRPAA